MLNDFDLDLYMILTDKLIPLHKRAKIVERCPHYVVLLGFIILFKKNQVVILSLPVRIPNGNIINSCVICMFL